MVPLFGLDLQGCLGVAAEALGLDGGQIVKILAHYSGHQPHTGQLHHRVLIHQSAVARDRDPVAHGIHLLQEVGDKYDAHLVLFELAHHLEELFHLAVGQKRRWARPE